MVPLPLLILFYFLIPVIITGAGKKLSLLNRISPVITAYVFGILIGNTGLVSKDYFDTIELISGISVIFALPLMLFSTNLSRLKAIEAKASVSMIFSFISITAATALGFFIFGKNIPEYPQAAGLMVGVYTGGTPNLAALKTAMNVSSDTYLAIHTADILVTGLYFIFLLSAGKRLFRKLLKPYAGLPDRQQVKQEIITNPLTIIMNNPGSTVVSLLISAAVVGAGIGASILLSGKTDTIILILSTTTFSLILSFIPFVRKQAGSFALGEMIILVFCIAVGSMADLSNLMTTIPEAVGYVSFTVFVSVFFHTALCRISGIDADTMLITSTSAIYSPPFVPAMAMALGNREILLAGVTTGLIGYAAGNYLGILISQILQVFI